MVEKTLRDDRSKLDDACALAAQLEAVLEAAVRMQSSSEDKERVEHLLNTSLGLSQQLLGVFD